MKEIKQAAIGIGTILLYLFFILFGSLYQQYLYVLWPEIPTGLLIAMALIMEITLLSTILLIFNKTLVKDFKDLKKNHQKHFEGSLKYWLIGLAVMYGVNLTITLFNQNAIPSNEDAIRQLFNISPLYIFISAVIIAPLNEELVFRKAFANIVNSKWLYIILSGLVFGSLHVILSIEKTYELWYIISYSALGVAFAYMYYQCKNIFIPVGFHLLHNGILIALQFLLMIFI